MANELGPDLNRRPSGSWPEGEKLKKKPIRVYILSPCFASGFLHYRAFASSKKQNLIYFHSTRSDIILFTKYSGGIIMALTAKIESNRLIISIDLETPTPSSSGKTLVVASTRGNKETDVMIDGKPVIIGLNAYIKK
jgi:hypothetical protein